MEKRKKMSLTEMAQALTEQRQNSRDFVVPTEKIEAVPSATGVLLSFNDEKIGHKSFGLNNWALTQVAAQAEIPKQYAERLAKENPELAAKNINHGLKNHAHEGILLRTYKDTTRAFLSSKYRKMDCYEMVEALYPTIKESGLLVDSAELSEKRLYLKLVSPTLMAEIKKGDIVQYGLVLSNSDVGAGAHRIEPFINRLVCTNGMVSNVARRFYHRTKDQLQDEAFELYSDETRDVTDSAFWMQVQDIVKATLNPQYFEKEILRLQASTNDRIENYNLGEVVEQSLGAFKITGEKYQNSILAALANGNEGAGLTKYGLIQSFTRAAQDSAFDADEAIKLERAAGQILDWSKNQWEKIAIPA